MKRWYEMAIEKGCVDSMYNIALYYEDIEKDYNLMKFYYEMAIEKGCSASMNNLAYHYELIEKDYTLMKKYYEMALEKGHIISMYNFGLYYQEIEKDYDKMKMYLEMGNEKGHEKCKDTLESYYTLIANFDIDGLKFALKYKNTRLFDGMISRLYKDEIEIDDKLFDILKEVDTSIFHLPKVYQHLISSLSTHIDLLENHYKYQPKGYGFEDAKKEFISTSFK